MKHSDFVVTELPEDPRLDKVIPLHVKTLSRGAARRLIEGGAVYVNRKRCQQNGRRMHAGDQVRIMEAPESAPSRQATEWEFSADRILFENEDLIVVNKPPGIPTHETIDSSRHHLVRSLQLFLGKRDQLLPQKVYLGIHHRLDVNTSGALLFTKRREANSPVAQAFQNRELSKTYLAVCLGTLPGPLTIKSFLAESRQNRRVVCSVQSGGKYAETSVRSLETRTVQMRELSLIEAAPRTGRTHQIRVHLAENGLPILGDESYGVRFSGVERVLLHAWKLELLGRSFAAPFPGDFLALGFRDPSGAPA